MVLQLRQNHGNTKDCPKLGVRTSVSVMHPLSITSRLPRCDATGFSHVNLLTFGQHSIVCACVCVKFSHHLIVLLRFGWLTVLSSMKIVEQELYFFDIGPGDTLRYNNMY